MYLWNGQVSGNLTCTVAILFLKEKKEFIWNCLSAIRFRGGVILQVSCYTLLTPIPTSVATVLMSTPHGTPFRVYRKVGADMLWPCLSWERQVESLIARTAYQLWPTTNLRYSQRPSYLSKDQCSHRFKVWEKAEVVKIRPTDTSSHCFTLFWYVFCVCVTLCLDSSYPEGNFGENQLLDGSISLSPLYSVQEATICTSVPHNASFHQVFTWLHHVRE